MQKEERSMGRLSPRTSRILLPLLAAAAMVALLAAPGASPTSTAHNPVSFTDPTGDSAAGPDITGVTISNTVARVIRFQVAIANTVILPENHFVGIFIDADSDTSNGPFGGYEHTIQTAGAAGQAVFARWDGTTYVPTAAPSLVKIWVSGGTMTFEISAADLGNATEFASWVGTEVLPQEGDFDDTAPDGDAVHTYTLSSPHIVSAAARYSIAAPRAGRRFSATGVTFQLTSKEQLPATSLRCRATLAGRAVRGSGRGNCTFALAKTARGKRLAITITATLGAESRTLRSTFRVR
jgi:hypothetical protein